MRWLGALLLVGACGSVGWQKTGGLRRKIALLDGLCRQLRQMENELLQRGTPLPDLMEQLGHSPMAARLRSGMTARAAAQPMLEKLAGELPQTARTMEDLWAVLGRYDGPTQARACGHALRELEAQKEALSRELAEKGNLYRAVPLAFGLMAALAVL